MIVFQFYDTVRLGQELAVKYDIICDLRRLHQSLCLKGHVSYVEVEDSTTSLRTQVIVVSVSYLAKGTIWGRAD